MTFELNRTTLDATKKLFKLTLKNIKIEFFSLRCLPIIFTIIEFWIYRYTFLDPGKLKNYSKDAK